MFRLSLICCVAVHSLLLFSVAFDDMQYVLNLVWSFGSFLYDEQVNRTLSRLNARVHFMNSILIHILHIDTGTS